MAVGGKLLSTDWESPRIALLNKLNPNLSIVEKTFGSLCIVTAFVFLVDAIATIIKFKKVDLKNNTREIK